jgi:hypothetical protein
MFICTYCRQRYQRINSSDDVTEGRERWKIPSIKATEKQVYANISFFFSFSLTNKKHRQSIARKFTSVLLNLCQFVRCSFLGHFHFKNESSCNMTFKIILHVCRKEKANHARLISIASTSSNNKIFQMEQCLSSYERIYDVLCNFIYEYFL